MISKVLITGPPRCGKTTLIKSLIKHYKELNYQVYGLLTPEVRKGNKRIGFDILDVHNEQRYKLARISGIRSKYQLGKYSVNIEDLNKLLSHFKRLSLKKADLTIIDEIGKMELFSKMFQEFIRQIFTSEIKIIATIGQTLKHPTKNFVLNLPNIKIITLSRESQEEAFNEIISLIK